MVEGAASNVKLGPVYFNRAERTTALPMEIANPAADGKFSVNAIPGNYTLSFDPSISRLGIRSVTLDDKPILNWRFQIDGSVASHKLVIIVGGSQQ